MLSWDVHSSAGMINRFGYEGLSTTSPFAFLFAAHNSLALNFCNFSDEI